MPFLGLHAWVRRPTSSAERRFSGVGDEKGIATCKRFYGRDLSRIRHYLFIEVLRLSLEVLSIIVLLLMFVVGAAVSVNIGLLGFVAAFVIGTMLAGLGAGDVYASFPVNMLILLAGVSYLFSIAQKNGTLDMILSWGLRLVGGRVTFLPWVLFALSAALTTIGESTVALAPILFPFGLQLAYKYKINPLLVSLLIMTGIYAGSFSPISPYGLIVKGILDRYGFSYSSVDLFLNCLLYYFIISVICFILFGGLRLMKNKAVVETGLAGGEAGGENRLNFHKAATILGIVALVVLGLGFNIDIGFGALMIGLVLSLMAPKQTADVLKQVPWTVIVMVTGIITYIGIMQKIGAMDLMNRFIENIGNPYFASLIATYIGGFVSAFASTSGLISAIIPLTVPILQDPAMSVVGVITSLVVGASVVDISPFSTIGALVVANVRGVNERVFFRNLIYIAAGFLAIGPGLAWLLFVVGGSLV